MTFTARFGLVALVVEEKERETLIDTCRQVIESRARFAFMDVARAMVTAAELAGDLPSGANCTPGQLALHLGINRQTQANWRSRDTREWMKRMQESLDPIHSVVPSNGEGRRRKLLTRHWEFVAEVSSRYPAISWHELAEKVKAAAGKESSGVPELRRFSRVTAWRNRYVIQKYVAALDARRASIVKPAPECPPEAEAAQEEVATTTPTEPRVELQDEFMEMAKPTGVVIEDDQLSGGGVELDEPPLPPARSGDGPPSDIDPW